MPKLWKSWATSSRHRTVTHTHTLRIDDDINCLDHKRVVTSLEAEPVFFIHFICIYIGCQFFLCCLFFLSAPSSIAPTSCSSTTLVNSSFSYFLKSTRLFGQIEPVGVTKELSFIFPNSIQPFFDEKTIDLMMIMMALNDSLTWCRIVLIRFRIIV